MSDADTYRDRTDAPRDRPTRLLDVRADGPPVPLQRTLELVPELPAETVLVQLNDRAPQYLYPKLTDRGYTFDTLDTEEGVITAIWREDV